METEEEVDILMSSDIYSATLSTKSITFTRAQTGWLFREDKTVSKRKLSDWHCRGQTRSGSSVIMGLAGKEE